jgi:hypothetical protein
MKKTQVWRIASCRKAKIYTVKRVDEVVPHQHLVTQDQTTHAKKIYRLKEDQAFWLSLELGRREKVARHPSAEFLPSQTCPPHLFLTDNDATSVLGGGGGQAFVDSIIAVTTRKA